ncbi:hypothetical protein RYX36_023255, partial [Vicia faba]
DCDFNYYDTFFNPFYEIINVLRESTKISKHNFNGFHPAMRLIRLDINSNIDCWRNSNFYKISVIFRTFHIHSGYFAFDD